ncbi:MAG: hypothetical protein GKR87_08595 [Kiritimatiellae bacterium]|nr:hypothetical protein [Kiritimatiellia bacterium]
MDQAHEPWEKKLIETALALKSIGKLSPEVIETERGFHILKYNGIRKGRSYPLSTVKEKIRRTLAAGTKRKIYRETVARLKEDSLVVVNGALFNTIKNPASLGVGKEEVIDKLKSESLAYHEKEAEIRNKTADISVSSLPESGELTIEAIPMDKQSRRQLNRDKARAARPVSVVDTSRKPGRGKFITTMTEKQTVTERPESRTEGLKGSIEGGTP